MSNFVGIKSIDYKKQDDILEALEFIKSKFSKRDVIPDFFLWYGNLVATVQAHDLYEIIGLTPEQLEDQRLFIEKFESTFAQQFLDTYTRKEISHIRSMFKRGCVLINDYELFLGRVEDVASITRVFAMFKEYAEFVINIYQPIYLKLFDHLSKEGTELTNFIDITKIKGKVKYEPMIGEAKLKDIPFVKELFKCQDALLIIDEWFRLKPFDTNIPIGDPDEEEIVIVTILT